MVDATPNLPDGVDTRVTGTCWNGIPGSVLPVGVAPKVFKLLSGGCVIGNTGEADLGLPPGMSNGS